MQPDYRTLAQPQFLCKGATAMSTDQNPLPTATWQKPKDSWDEFYENEAKQREAGYLLEIGRFGIVDPSAYVQSMLGKVSSANGSEMMTTGSVFANLQALAEKYKADTFAELEANMAASVVKPEQQTKVDVNSEIAWYRNQWRQAIINAKQAQVQWAQHVKDTHEAFLACKERNNFKR